MKIFKLLLVSVVFVTAFLATSAFAGGRGHRGGFHGGSFAGGVVTGIIVDRVILPPVRYYPQRIYHAVYYPPANSPDPFYYCYDFRVSQQGRDACIQNTQREIDWQAQQRALDAARRY